MSWAGVVAADRGGLGDAVGLGKEEEGWVVEVVLGGQKARGVVAGFWPGDWVCYAGILYRLVQCGGVVGNVAMR